MKRKSHDIILQRMPRTRLHRVGMLLGAVTCCLLVAKLCFLATHLLDQDTYKIRGALRFRPHPTVYEADWLRAEAMKSAMPKDSTYQGMTTAQLREQMPIRVITLARATDRRATVIKNLKEAGLTRYELVDAVDAKNTSIPEQEVARYIRGVRLQLWRKGLDFQRGKVAIDLSHYQNLERIARENRTAILIEDDAAFPHTRDWYADLLKALQDLPQDWDILYLNACFYTVGKAIGKHLAVLKSGACTLGYVATPKFAKFVLTALKSANRRGHGPIVDLFYQSFIYHHELNAYICQPPLVSFTGTPSTIDYSHAHHNLTSWDRYWSGR